LRPGEVTGTEQQVITGEDAGEEEGEEGRHPVRARAPHQVSNEERDIHELTHTPYRAWCRHCVRARGRNTPHRAGEPEHKSKGVPKIAMDYFFMGKVDEQASTNPLIVMVDEDTGEKYARAVGHKGIGKDNETEWLIKDLALELRAWGHNGGEGGHIILKSDGERSIVAVRDALARYHGGKVVPESPPKGESQSNGAIEEAGKTTREFVRVLKEHVEDHAKMKLECDDVVVMWMVRWAAMMVSRYLVGRDGMTAYERRRGRKCKLPVVSFGEKVWYKELRTGKERKNKFESEWQEGLWLGHSRESNEMIIGTKDGVIRAYAIKRKAADERWDVDLLKNMKGTPQQPDPSKPGSMVPIRINFDPPVVGEHAGAEVDQEENSRQIRRMKITPEVLKKYGFTEGCDGCKFKAAGLREGRNHTTACRARIEKEMQANELDKDKFQRSEDRINWRLAEQREKNLKEDETKKAVEENLGGGDPPDSGGASASAGPVAFDIATPVGTPRGGPTTTERTSTGGDKRKKEDDEGWEQLAAKVRRGPETTTNARRDEDGDAEMTGDKVETAMVLSLRRISVDVAEMYSPPRVTTEAKKFGLSVGEAMDLTTGWDFTKSEDRDRAVKYIDEHKPKLIVGSPMCKMFSQLQRMTRWTSEKQRRWREDRDHLKFMAEVYKKQVENGRWFLHEHPASASSWSLQEIQAVLNMEGVGMVTGDQCMYGLKTWGMNGKEASAKKSTGFMSNSKAILHELSKKCDGTHKHQRLVNDRAKDAERYSEELCRAICVGLMKENRNNTMNICKLIDLDPSMKIENNKDEHEDGSEEYLKAWDDVSGEELNPMEVKKARSKEMKYIEEKGVWRVVSRREAESRGVKIIKTRWIDIDKGDKTQPNYRSRLVAKEYNDGEQEGLFASTPPLEALRLIISMTATMSKGKSAKEKVIMTNDVARAFFEAKMKRTVCVEIPAEADVGELEREDAVGLLELSLYGTRDAAANFQEEVRKFMVSIGFEQCKYSPSMYYHRKRDIQSLVHGDDFVSSADRAAAKWFEGELAKRFEIKTQVVGTGTGEAREGRILNRVIRVTEEGWEYEADQRHADLIVKAMGMQEANGVKTPGEDERAWEEEENNLPLHPREVTNFRAIAARANYLALDRADIQYAAKEICRGMSAPTAGHLKKLRRLARYLVSVPRVVWEFHWQGAAGGLTAFSDSDWAGCRRTAKSTSGGAILRGGHCIKTWSSTQKSITLSSAEAELVAAVKASCELIGAMQMTQAWGEESAGEVYVDSSAALAVVARKGSGKLRHVRVGCLWIQEKANSGELKFVKIPGELNPADAMTKHLTGSKILDLTRRMSQVPRTGRAQSGLVLNALQDAGARSADRLKAVRPRGSANTTTDSYRV
jgi:hypothetical protein